MPGWENLYSVSNRGRVRREPRTVRYLALNRWGWEGLRTIVYSRQVLKVNIDSGGYAQVVLQDASSNPPRRATYGVHRLVLSAFRRKPGPEEHGMHRNDVRHDNRLCNLKWGTRQANAADMAGKGRRRRPPNRRLPLEPWEVAAIQAQPEAKREALALQFGTSKSNIDKLRAKARRT